MEGNSIAGYREIEHVADWELNVWAPDFPALLVQAAKGMDALSGLKFEVEPCHRQKIVLAAQDQESLLVAFLSELLFIAQLERLGFDRFDIHITAETPTEKLELQANLEGYPIQSLNKEIKAVTYHNLKIRQTDKGLETNIVFDI